MSWVRQRIFRRSRKHLLFTQSFIIKTYGWLPTVNKYMTEIWWCYLVPIICCAILKWLKELVSYYSPDRTAFERLIHEKVFSPAIITILVKPYRQLSLNNPRRLVDCDDDSDIGSYSYTYLSHSQGQNVRFIPYPLSFLLHRYVCQDIVVRKVFSSVHLDRVEFYHSPDNQLLQRPFCNAHLLNSWATSRTFVTIPNRNDYWLNKTIPADPAQYTRLIFLRLRQISQENCTG